MAYATTSLPHRITVESFEGEDGNGERIYGTPRTGVPAIVQRKRRVLRSADDTAIVCDVAIQVRPEVGRLVGESRITFEGKPYYVQACEDDFNLRRLEGFILSCIGPRSSE
ncbi:hypothetical protein UFOVP1360_52 [uncultured Caudovirales phage]|uniref:Head-tail adaptor protein n=1 Tax=uncultured Caudovirales phage TaxID=2100421 RepID=A0A6J5S4R2_9CAUD|nr:hypothetical protein UFOVP1360_52 [uncultured Caudovirales phage]